MIRNPIASNIFRFTIHDAKGEQLYTYSSQKLQQFAWRPRPQRNWTEKQKREFKKLYKNSLRKEIIEADEKAKSETLEFYKLQKEKTKEKFLDIIKPLQQRYAETKDKRRAIGAESDSEDEEEFVRYAIIDYH